MHCKWVVTAGIAEEPVKFTDDVEEKGNFTNTWGTRNFS